MRSPRFPERRKSEFSRFIESYGVEALAAQLGIDPSTIYHWLRGVSAPRRTHAEIIQRLARERGTTLTLDAIYAHASERRASDPAVAVAIGRHRKNAEAREAKKAARDAAVDVLLKSRFARESLAGS